MEIQPAASAILLRASDIGPPQILITERSARMRFAGGAYVFPGGRVDAADLATAQDPTLTRGAEGLDPDDAAARVAAIRETLEESGLLLTVGPRPDPEQLNKARNMLAQGPDSAEACTFAAMLAGLAHKVDAGILHPFARWMPSNESYVSRRFLARFYLIDVSAHDVSTLAADGQEAVSMHWFTAAELLDRHVNKMLFPTHCLIARIAQYPDIPALLAAAARHGDRLMQPSLTERDGERWVSIPPDQDYPYHEARVRSLRCD